MKYSLRALSLKLFRSNKLVVMTSILNIAIAVSLVITMFLFSVNAGTSIKKELHKTYGQMDLLVEYADTSQNHNVLTQIKSNSEIDKLSQVRVSNFTIDKLNNKVYTVGVHNDDLTKSRYRFSVALHDYSVAMNESLAKALNLKVGQSVLIEQKSFVLVEIMKDISTTGIIPDLIAIPYETQKKISIEKQLTNWQNEYLLVKVKRNVDSVHVASKIKKYGDNVKLDIIEEDPSLKNNMDSLRQFIVVISILILIVTSFLINSNFDILLYKYKNQLAIMRTLGATTKQMSQIIFIQSSIINILGLVLGVICACLSDKFVYQFLEMFFSHSFTYEKFNTLYAITIAGICGIAIQLFMFIPMYRSTKVLPLKIMNDNEKLGFGHAKARKVIGYILLGLSGFLVIMSLGTDGSGNIKIIKILFSGFMMIIGFFVLFPIYLPNMLRAMLPFTQRFLSKEFYIAIKNLIPQVKKSTYVILTVVFLMVITIFGTVMLNSVKANEVAYLKKQYPTPIVLKNRVTDKSVVDYSSISKSIESLSTVKDTSSISTFGLGVMQSQHNTFTIDYQLGDLKKMAQQKILPVLPEGDVKNTIIISADLARHYHLSKFDVVKIGLYKDTSSNDINYYGNYVIGAVTSDLNGEKIYMDWSNTPFYTKDINLQQIYVRTDHINATLKQLEMIRRSFPEVQISNYKESLALASEMFYQRWSIFIAVIVSLTVSIALGVFNSFTMNITSKRKEFAVLRSLGVTPRGIRNIIVAQTTIYLGIGLIMGIVLGYLFTFILSLVDSGTLILEYKMIFVITLVMMLLNVIIFNIISRIINKKPVPLELTEDNK